MKDSKLDSIRHQQQPQSKAIRNWGCLKTLFWPLHVPADVGEVVGGLQTCAGDAERASNGQGGLENIEFIGGNLLQLLDPNHAAFEPSILKLWQARSFLSFHQFQPPCLVYSGHSDPLLLLNEIKCCSRTDTAELCAVCFLNGARATHRCMWHVCYPSRVHFVQNVFLRTNVTGSAGAHIWRACLDGISG